MQVQYLEIVTPDVDAVCAAYAQVHGVQFGEPEAGLGGARTAALAGGIYHRPYWPHRRWYRDSRRVAVGAQHGGNQFSSRSFSGLSI